MPAPGAISTIFWWRRCRLHSRSQRCLTSPLPSPSDLHLDVAGAPDQLLDVDVAVAERGRGLGAAAREGLGELVRVAHDAHAAAAAAGHRP